MAILKQVVDLQETVKNLMAQNEILRRERDRAVEDIRMLGRMGANICPVCAHYNHGKGTNGECVKCLTGDGFRWRGKKGEDDANNC